MLQFSPILHSGKITQNCHILVDSGTLKPSESKEFSIRLWIKRDAGNDMENTSYTSKVAVTGKGTVDKNKRSSKNIFK